MKQKRNKIKQLEVFYLLIIALGILIIAPTHIFPQPTFMYARFPHYLELMGPFLGLAWPKTFEIYHNILYILATIISLNGLGLVSYPLFKKLTIFSSIIGMFVFSLMILFFFLVFITVNTSTAVTFGLYSLILLALELLIFRTLAK